MGFGMLNEPVKYTNVCIDIKKYIYELFFFPVNEGLITREVKTLKTLQPLWSVEDDPHLLVVMSELVFKKSAPSDKHSSSVIPMRVCYFIFAHCLFLARPLMYFTCWE